MNFLSRKMEAPEIESKVEATEKLLVHSNQREIDKVVDDASTRATLVNSIAMPMEELLQIAASSSSIDSFIEERLLADNKEMARLKKAGIRLESLSFEMPTHLVALRNRLRQFADYRVGQFQFLRQRESGEWMVDEDALEQHLIDRKFKIYIQGDELKEYRRIEELCELLTLFAIPWTHVRSSSKFSELIEANGQGYRPKWQRFANRR